MPTDQPRSTDDLSGIVVPPPLEVEGGAPRGPDHASPIDPGMPPTDADGSTAPTAEGIGVPEASPDPT